MISAIFQTETTALESQVLALQAQIAAHTARIALLHDAEFVAGDSLEALKTAIQKVSSLAPSAVSNLRAAVLNLFTGNDGNTGNEPDPEPQPGNDGGEEVAIAGQSSPFASPFASPLASPLACVLASTIEVADPLEQINAVLEAEAKRPYVELIEVSPSVAYNRKSACGEIICTYLAGNNKNRLKDWGSWLCNQHTVGSGFELREAKHLTTFKHEIKIWGMAIEDIQKLAQADTTKSPASNYGNAPKRVLEPVAPAPELLTLNDIGVGDIVRSKMIKHWEYRVLGITEGKFLDVERLNVVPQIRLGGHPEGFELVSKAIDVALTEEEISIGNASIQPPEPCKPIDDLYITNTAAATGYSANPIGRAGAAKNWEILQAQRAEQRRTVQTAVIEAPQPAPVASKIAAGDWVELLATGERCQVEEVNSQGVYVLTDDGTANVQEDEVKLLMHIPDDWKPF